MRQAQPESCPGQQRQSARPGDKDGNRPTLVATLSGTTVLCQRPGHKVVRSCGLGFVAGSLLQRRANKTCALRLIRFGRECS